jgi:hypothetical protein
MRLAGARIVVSGRGVRGCVEGAYPALGQAHGDREIPEARRSTALSVEKAVETACEGFGCRREELANRTRGIRYRERKLAMPACQQYTRAPKAAFAEVFGIAAAAVSTGVRRTPVSLLQNRDLQKD